MICALRPFTVLAVASAARIGLDVSEEHLSPENDDGFSCTRGAQSGHNQLGSFTGYTREQCRQECAENVECLSFDSSSHGDECYLSTTKAQGPGGGHLRSNDRRYVYCEKRPECPVGQVACAGACMPESEGICCYSTRCWVNRSYRSCLGQEQWYPNEENKQCCQGIGILADERWVCDADQTCVGDYNGRNFGPREDGTSWRNFTTEEIICGVHLPKRAEPACQVGQVDCAGNCMPEGEGVCCYPTPCGGNQMPDCQESERQWFPNEENKQCCQGTSYYNAEHWMCEANQICVSVQDRYGRPDHLQFSDAENSCGVNILGGVHDPSTGESFADRNPGWR